MSSERRLVLMRHAKSSWDGDVEDDHARPLNDRGRREASKIADRLVDLRWVPARVVTSDSVRTLETWERMVGRMPPAIEVLQTRRLYHAGFDALAEVLGEQPNQFGTVLVLGHNPGWEEAARRLTGMPIGLTTATAVLLSRATEAGWREVLADGETWTVADILRPP